MSALTIATVAALGVAVAAALALAWRGASALLVPRPYALMPEFEVLAYRDGRVTLPAPPTRHQFADTRKHGTFGLLWDGGHGVLGAIESDDGARVVRRLEVVVGTPPRAGSAARLDTFVYRRDPLQDRGLPYEEVTVAGEVGPLSGWWLPGTRAPAVLVLHGRRRGERAEALRALPALAEDGRPVLVMAYRNHRDAPASPDGVYTYGRDEAADALAGVRFLAEQGATRAVLVGFSMGGATALEALKRWPDDGPELAGLVLDAPLVDPAAAVVQRVRRSGLPLAAAWGRLVLGLAGWRSGVRWRDLDQRRSAHAVTVPVLLVTGVDDGTVPVATVDAFAARLAGPTRYQRVEGADHLEAWNRDPEAYEGWLRAFLAGLEAA